MAHTNLAKSKNTFEHVLARFSRKHFTRCFWPDNCFLWSIDALSKSKSASSKSAFAKSLFAFSKSVFAKSSFARLVCARLKKTLKQRPSLRPEGNVASLPSSSGPAFATRSSHFPSWEFFRVFYAAVRKVRKFMPYLSPAIIWLQHIV